MATYLQWMALHWDNLSERLPEMQRHYTDLARAQGSAHMRMPGNVAVMQTGWAMMLEFFRDIGVLSEDDRALWNDIGWGTFLKIGGEQHAMIVEENPVDMYLEALQEMFAQGTIYLVHRDQMDIIPDGEADRSWPKHRIPTAMHIGWYDDRFWYLIPRGTYQAVWRFYAAMGKVFPDSDRGLHTKLNERGMLLVQDAAHLTYRMPSGSKTRVLRLHIPGSENVSENL
jgi:hypothetical protein